MPATLLKPAVASLAKTKTKALPKIDAMLAALEAVSPEVEKKPKGGCGCGG